MHLHSLIASDLWTLCKGTEVEYNEAALSLRNKMAPYPAQLSYLNGYINAPETFAAYERNKIPGSQYKCGSTHAEQNHTNPI
jgi:hypothetical protein